MTDSFAILEVPRRPWLDPAMLKEKFFRMAAERHPDKTGLQSSAQFTELNAAFALLRDPAARLRHLLDLEFPGQFRGTPPFAGTVSEIFPRMAAFSPRLSEFARGKARASMPLTRALLAAERIELERQAQEIGAAITFASEAALDELRVLDAGWNPADAAVGERLAQLQHQLVFLTRWHDQVREALFTLRAGEI